MTTDWSPQHIATLAPDSASLKAAQKLLSSRNWPLLGSNEQALWGHCLGSGSKPYLVRIELDEPAFKCSCPSRKFPCKHALALLLLYGQDRTRFQPPAAAPDWVQEWLDSRAQRKSKQATKTASKAADPVAQSKRQEQRAEKVARGVEELQRWLEDLVRAGLADLPGKPYRFWDNMRARLIDAQAPGLANRVQGLATLVASANPDWSERLLEQLGQLYLLLQAFQRLDQLDPLLQQDVRGLIGWPFSKDTILQQPACIDDWVVLSREQTENDNLITLKIWLYGQQQRQSALLLYFAPTSQRAHLPGGLLSGQILHGAVHYYPSATPLRALLGEHRIVTTNPPALNGHDNCEQALQAYHQALLRNPWLDTYPLLLNDVRLQYCESRLCLHDRTDQELPLRASNTTLWHLLALAGSEPCTLFGEWDGTRLRALGIADATAYNTVLETGL